MLLAAGCKAQPEAHELDNVWRLCRTAQRRGSASPSDEKLQAALPPLQSMRLQFSRFDLNIHPILRRRKRAGRKLRKRARRVLGLVEIENDLIVYRPIG